MSIGLQGLRGGLFSAGNSLFGQNVDSGPLSRISQPIFSSPEETPSPERSESDSSDNPLSGEESTSLSRSPFGSITARLTVGGVGLNEADSTEQGGTTGFVTGGSVTLTNDKDETLSVQSDDQITLRRQEDGSVKITGTGSDESLTVSSGESVETSGDGRINLFSNGEFASIQGGKSVSFRSEDGQTTLTNTTSESKISLASSDNEITVESVRSGQTDSLTFLTDQGPSITFQQGETGTIEQNEDGTITITNTSTSRSVTVADEGNLDLVGEAEATLTSGSTGETMELQKGQDLALSNPEGDGFTLSNDSELNQIAIEGSQPSEQPEGRLQVQYLENPVTLADQFITRNLIQARPTEDSNQSDSNSPFHVSSENPFGNEDINGPSDLLGTKDSDSFGLSTDQSELSERFSVSSDTTSESQFDLMV